MRTDAARSARLIEEDVPLSPDAPASGSAADAAARTRARRRAIGRAALVATLLVAALIAAYFVPLPSISMAREWSESLGPWFPWLFFLTYTVVTLVPVPRSSFTIAAGVLFAPGIAFTGSMIASAFSAAIAFAVVRRLGRARVRPLLRKPIVAAIERRLAQRGWLAVGSLRLIGAVPFSLVNYLSGLSSIRFVPFIVATCVGNVPGTAAVVFLGDALTDKPEPLMLVLTAALFMTGIVGLVIDARMPVKDSDLPVEESSQKA